MPISWSALCNWPVLTPSNNQGIAIYHQLKGVPVFLGSTSQKHNLKVEDWARDMTYLLTAKGSQPSSVQFHEVVRHTKGRARIVVLNLESRDGVVTAEAAITELVDEFGEEFTTSMLIATFFTKKQRSGESTSDVPPGAYRGDSATTGTTDFPL